MSNKLLCVIAFAGSCALVVATVGAEESNKVAGSTGKTPSVAEQIRAINEQMAVLSAQLNEADLRAKIAVKNEELRRANSGDISSQKGAPGGQPGQTGQPALPSNLQTLNAKEEMPIVQAIEGVDGKLKATLAMRSSGTVQTVSQGDAFGDWSVKTIRINEVTITRGKTATRLPFGTAPENSLSQGAASRTGSGMPMGGQLPGFGAGI
jgi:type IV pilus biogenesis protein PilP